MVNLKEGDKAPNFSGLDEQENPIGLGDYKGKKLILYFYPKDNTPGCTKEACNLRDNYQELKNQGFEVLGVSMDTAKKHAKFIAKYDLPFKLLADTEKSTIEAFEAWGLKKFMGRKYEGILRKTFVIDEEGTIVKIIEKVKTADHTQQILDALA